MYTDIYEYICKYLPTGAETTPPPFGSLYKNSTGGLSVNPDTRISGLLFKGSNPLDCDIYTEDC